MIDLKCTSKVHSLSLQILALRLGEHTGDCWKSISLAFPRVFLKMPVLSVGSLDRKETWSVHQDSKEWGVTWILAVSLT